MNFFKLCVITNILILITSFIIFGNNSTYTIEGEVSFKGKGSIYILLVNEETFKKRDAVLQKIERKLSVEELSKGKFEFSFENIPKGEYGIKCFIDENGNKKLDKSVFGPTEPWGMSWKDKKPFGPPKFSQMSFKLDHDIKINIEVE